MLSEGAEIKIRVGSTPIAVSTQLPAAVVQLSQKGNIENLTANILACLKVNAKHQLINKGHLKVRNLH